MKKYLYLFFSIAFTTGGPYYSFAQIITTFAGNGYTGSSGDGFAATNARLHLPTSIAIDPAGNLYINDQLNYNVRKVDPAGIITTIAGIAGVHTSTGDGGPATNATFIDNWGVAADNSGYIYVTDEHGYKVRAINPSGTINVIAGNGGISGSGMGGPATNAAIGTPIGIAADPWGNIYFCDNTNYWVDQINTSGIITKVAGSIPGFGGDGGPATNARLGEIYGMAADDAGNIYICDASNHRVRKVNTAGIITTIAGNGTPGFGGDNGPAANANLNRPTGVFVTYTGYIYIADYGNHRIRKVSPDGIITTVAGTGSPGYNGDNIPATSAELFHPIGVIVDTFENIYIADMDNARIRKVVNVLSFTGGDFQGFNVCENSTPRPIDSLLAIRDVYPGNTDTWSLQTAPVHGTAYVGYAATSTGGIIMPSGLTYTPAAGYIGPDSFKVKVANLLSSDIITIYVTVDAFVSAGTITGPSSVCIGSSITLSNTTPGGNWSSSALATVTPLTLSCSVTGVAAGIDTIAYTISNACGTIFTSTIVTVEPLPDAGTVGGANAVCKGSIITLTATQPGGTWSSSNALTASVGSTTGQVKGLLPGTVTIAYAVANAWCTATVLHPVTIEIFPDAGTILGAMHVCLGNRIEMSNAVAGGEWTSSNSSLTIESGTVTGVSVGTGDISYSVTNSCGTEFTTKSVTVNPIPDAPIISENQDLLSVPRIYSSYQWYVNGNIIPGENMDTCSATTSGAYNVMVTNAFGCSNSSETLEYTDCVVGDIVIYPNPTASILNIQWCKRVTVKLMCDDGKEIAINKQVNKIDISGLPNADYILSVYDGHGKKLMTKRITKLTK